MLERYMPPAEISVPLDSFALGWLYPYIMHWKMPLFIAAAYTMFIMKISPQKPLASKAPPLRRTQSPIFKAFVILHNVALAAFSLWTLVSMASGLAANLRTYGWYEGICDLNFTMWNSTLFRFSYYFYLSKYYEFIDTLIILFKGRRASLLQMYHHAGAVITMWAGCYYVAVPIAFFVIVNSAIHTWMYTFYALTAAGIRPPGKRLLTSSQIFQFVFGISICFFYILYPGCENDRQKIAIYINLAYIFPLLGLFVSFFTRTYSSSSAGAKKHK
ncbi:fatty acid elongase [Martensiomyces pterosporus]|nr:fatty acid elongase [Martensiomyces pterosporus]